MKSIVAQSAAFLPILTFSTTSFSLSSCRIPTRSTAGRIRCPFSEMLSRRGSSLDNNSRVDLCRYRLEKTQELLEAAKTTLSLQLYETAANRSYYAIFHAVRALLALEGKDSKSIRASYHFSSATTSKRAYSTKSFPTFCGTLSLCGRTASTRTSTLCRAMR